MVQEENFADTQIDEGIESNTYRPTINQREYEEKQDVFKGNTRWNII